MSIISQDFGEISWGKCATGTFTVAVNSTTQVRDLGFQPKKLLVYRIDASGEALVVYSTMVLYDEELSTSKQYRYAANTNSGISANAGGDVLDIPETVAGYRIANVNPQGFDYICGGTAGWAGTYRYIAIG